MSSLWSSHPSSKRQEEPSRENNQTPSLTVPHSGPISNWPRGWQAHASTSPPPPMSWLHLSTKRHHKGHQPMLLSIPMPTLCSCIIHLACLLLELLLSRLCLNGTSTLKASYLCPSPRSSAMAAVHGTSVCLELIEPPKPVGSVIVWCTQFRPRPWIPPKGDAQ